MITTILVLTSGSSKAELLHKKKSRVESLLIEEVISKKEINMSKANKNNAGPTTIEGMEMVGRHEDTVVNNAYPNNTTAVGGDDDVSDDSMPVSEKLMLQEEQSFYSASENEHGDDNIWGLLSGVGGNIYEWYDFAVYGLLAPEIGACFFPSSSEKLQLINSFGVYLAAFLMR